jgi:hypothetical protein
MIPRPCPTEAGQQPEDRPAATANARPRQMQFIPCVEPKVFENTAPQEWDPVTLPTQNSPAAHPDHPDSVFTDWSVDPDDWGCFLCKVRDDWYRRDIGKVFVNHFETAVAQWMGKFSLRCIYHEFCGKGVALEHDGNLYSLRPLRLPRIQTRQHPGDLQFADGVLRTTAQVRFRQVPFLTKAMPRMQLPVRLQRRMPEKPLDPHSRRRARTELPVQWIAEILAPH